MATAQFDLFTRWVAGKTTRRSLLGAAVLGVFGATASGGNPRASATQSAGERNQVLPPPLPFDPSDLGDVDPDTDVKRSALYGNFDNFCRVVPYRAVGKLAVMDDDVIVGLAAEVEASDCVLRSGQAAPIDGAKYRWPSGIVPYAFHESLSQEQTELIGTALDYWNGLQLGLAWVPWAEANQFFRAYVPAAGGARDVVWFAGLAKPGVCASNVGRQEKPQVISLSDTCQWGSIVHELAHAAGLWHEQQRPDRDFYIEIVWDNIPREHHHNFELKYLVDLDDIPSAYDYDSIMHYSADAFSANGQPTIRTPNGELIGQRTGLSQGDMDAIRAMYPYGSACSCSAVGTACDCRL